MFYFTDNPVVDAMAWESEQFRLAEIEEREQEERKIWIKKNMVCKCCGEPTNIYSWMVDGLDDVYCEECAPDEANEVDNEEVYKEWNS